MDNACYNYSVFDLESSGQMNDITGELKIPFYINGPNNVPLEVSTIPNIKIFEDNKISNKPNGFPRKLNGNLNMLNYGLKDPGYEARALCEMLYGPGEPICPEYYKIVKNQQNIEK